MSVYSTSQCSTPKSVAFVVEYGAILYPPTTILLFAPFLVLPAFLWWAIPISITTAVVVRHRPSLWGWAIIAVLVADRNFWVGIVSANPGWWTLAALSLGTLYGWPAALVLLKPSLFPFAFWGIRRRYWWLALFAGLLFSLPFAPLFPDWIASMVNARGPNSGPLYSFAPGIETLFIPVVAWRFRSRVPQNRGEHGFRSLRDVISSTSRWRPRVGVDWEPPAPQ